MRRHKKIFIVAGVVVGILLVLTGIWHLAGVMVDATPKIATDEQISIPYQMPDIEEDDYQKYESMKAGNLIYATQKMFKEMGYETRNETITISEPEEDTIVLTYKSWVFTYKDGALIRCAKKENPTRMELEYMGDRYTKQEGEWVWDLEN